MESAENLIKKLKAIEPNSCSSLAQLLKTLNINNSLIINSNSNYRNKNFVSIFFENIKKILPRIELHKIFCQAISNEQHISQTLELIKNDSLFCDSKLLIFFNADRTKAKYLQTICKELSISSNSISILLTENDLPKTALESFKKYSAIEMPKLSGTKLEKWIINEAAKNSRLECEPEAIKYLSTEIGSDKIDEIEQIIQKAALLTNEKEKITLKSVLTCSKVKFERDVFELFNAVSKKDKLLIATCIESVLDSGNHPLQVFSYFNKSIKTLFAQLDKTPNGEHSKDLHNQWVFNKLNPRLFDKPRLEKILTKFAQLEFSLKDNGLDHEVALKHTLNQI